MTGTTLLKFLPPSIRRYSGHKNAMQHSQQDWIFITSPQMCDELMDHKVNVCASPKARTSALLLHYMTVILMTHPWAQQDSRTQQKFQAATYVLNQERSMCRCHSAQRFALKVPKAKHWVSVTQNATALNLFSIALAWIGPTRAERSRILLSGGQAVSFDRTAAGIDMPPVALTRWLLQQAIIMSVPWLI